MKLNDINIGFERIQRICTVRNYLLEKVRPYLVECQWVLCLDSDVYIDELNIKFMLDKLPKKHNIGMITTNGIVIHIPEETKEADDDGWVKYTSTPPKKKESFPVTFAHYYDTFAFVDKNDDHYHPYCASSQCISNECKTYVYSHHVLSYIYYIRTPFRYFT